MSLGFSRQEHWSGLPFPSPMQGSEREVAQSYPTLHDPMDCSPPGSSIHGIFQARVLEWGANCLLCEEISSFSHSIVFLYFFALVAEEGFLISSCYSLELCIQMLYLSFSPLLFASLLFTAICKASTDSWVIRTPNSILSKSLKCTFSVVWVKEFLLNSRCTGKMADIVS